MTVPTASSSHLQRIATTVAPPAVVVPAALLIGVTVLYRFYHFWRWIRIGLLWSNPDNFIQLSAGAGINLLFGDKVPLRVAALTVAIPSRVVDCIDEYNKLARAYQKWVEAIRGDYPRTPKVRWVKRSQGRAITPSNEIYWRENAVVLRIRVERIIRRTVKLAARSLILSMVCVDAVELLSLKKSACNRAVNELFLDGTNAIDRITRRKEEVQQKLEEGRPIANQLLKKLGTSYTVDRLIDSVSTALEGIEAADKGIKQVTGFGKGMAMDLLKHTVFGGFSLLGIPEKIPAKWFPGEWEEEHFEARPYEQYAPIESRVQPAMKSQTIPYMDVPLEIEIEVRRKPGKAPKAVPLERSLPMRYKLLVVPRIQRVFAH